MISIAQNSIYQTVNQYLFQYKNIFKKHSFEIFSMLIFGILAIEEIRSIKYIYDNFISRYFKKCLNSFYYFLSYSNISIDMLTTCTIKIAISLIPEEIKENMTIFLTIDDTLQSKFGTKFDCYFHLFDHTNKTGNSYLDGHCFVSLVVNIPLLYKGNTVRYLSLPVGYRLYDKEKSKLKIAAELIELSMQLLNCFQVILLCDSWYPKGDVINIVKKYDNLNIIAAIRSDTAMYELPPPPTNKKGRPRKHGDKLDYRMFDYEKEGTFFIATKKVMTNLFEKAVNITVTSTETTIFDSVRVFISTIDANDINIFKEYKVDGIENEPEKMHLLPITIYRFRWNIEVIFYEHKFFWSFGNYMVRNKNAIERYTNLLAVAFTFVNVLPFINNNYSSYKFQSPQVIKHAISAQLNKELILGTFVTRLENTEIYTIVKNAVITFLGLKDAA